MNEKNSFSHPPGDNEPFAAAILQQLCNERDEPAIIVKAERPRFEIVVYNEAFSAVSHSRGEDLTGQSMAEIKKWNTGNEDGALEIYDAMSKAAGTGLTIRLPAVRYDLPSGQNGETRPCWWQACYEPLIDSRGQAAYLLCTISEVTGMIKDGTILKDIPV